MIDLDELERLLSAADPAPWDGNTNLDLPENGRLCEALRNAAPELIAMARAGDALHADVCYAVALLNRFPGMSFEVADAQARLRKALADYADAMQKKPCGECHLSPGEWCDICGATQEQKP